MSGFGFNEEDEGGLGIALPSNPTTARDENETPTIAVGTKRIRFEEDEELEITGPSTAAPPQPHSATEGGGYGFMDTLDDEEEGDFGMSKDLEHGSSQSGNKSAAEAAAMMEEEDAGGLGSMLLYDSVTDVVKLQGTNFLKDTIIKVREYSSGDGGKSIAMVAATATAPGELDDAWGDSKGRKGGSGGGRRQGDKNAIVNDDPEYRFIVECSQLVWKLESEKTRAHLWLVAHYNLCFPELSQLIPSDAVTYAKCVQLIGGNMDLTAIVGDLEEMLPSQLIAVLIACASTTKVGERAFFPVRPLGTLDEAREKQYSDACASGVRRLQAINEACEQITLLEDTKQLFLEYIQHRMPLVCPNLCAFIGAPITSQMFALCGSLTALTRLDPEDVIQLGSKRGNRSGVDIHTSGFLANCDLVANHAPEMRAKALRLVAGKVVSLARIDENRRASDDQAGFRARQDVRISMVKWTDPLVHRGAANNTYERLSAAAREKRRRTEVQDTAGHFGQNKLPTGVVQFGV